VASLHYVIRSTREIRTLLLMLAALTVPSCSVYMEATRPTPVDLAQFHIGDARETVLEHIGTPQSSGGDPNSQNCDFYQLYTHGYGSAGKVPIAFLEGAADVVTLGLAEVVLTPTEGVTRNEQHRVTFCYKDQKLERMTEDGNCISGYCDETLSRVPAQAHTAAVPVSAPSPLGSPAGVASPVPVALQSTSVQDSSHVKASATTSADKPSVEHSVEPTVSTVPHPQDNDDHRSEDWESLPAQ